LVGDRKQSISDISESDKDRLKLKIIDSANVVSDNASPTSFLELAARRQKSVLEESEPRNFVGQQTNFERFKSPLTRRVMSPFDNDKSHAVITKDSKLFQNANKIAPKTEVTEDPLPIDSFVQKLDTT